LQKNSEGPKTVGLRETPKLINCKFNWFITNHSTQT